MVEFAGYDFGFCVSRGCVVMAGDRIVIPNECEGSNDVIANHPPPFSSPVKGEEIGKSLRAHRKQTPPAYGYRCLNAE
jgi:hypothetical protein